MSFFAKPVPTFAGHARGGGFLPAAQSGMFSTAPSPSMTTARTVCPYCGVGCGLIVEHDDSSRAAVRGDPEHPANLGGICSKGAALGETLGLEGRLLNPMLRQSNGSLLQLQWTDAIDHVAEGFSRILERDGPGALAFYLSGQLLTEDYYVANKLMKGYLGSANVDTNSRLCMASSVAGHRRAFGADTVPGSYADLDVADLTIVVGSNTAWCHPVLFQRMVRNKAERGGRLVVIDPRRTATAEEADLFLSIKPGTDTALFCGLLVHLVENDAVDSSFIESHTTGFAGALSRAREIAPDARAAAAATGLGEAEVACFFNLFERTERVVTCYSQGVNQSAQGTDKVNAIVNCHLATARIGKPGMGPFSLTGQPNAMGGREVGGLANQLAAHMGFDPVSIDRVRRFWNAPRMATHEGLKAVQMFEAIERGEIKALWVMATNPAVSLPRAGAVAAALKKLELFVVSENMTSTDTTNAAHVLLPALAWGEKEGTVTNSERRISRQRVFLPPPGAAKPDWWIVSQVACRMGFADAFGYRSAADVFREHAALSAFENNGTRDFDIGGLAAISDDAYDALNPVQWPLRAGEIPGERRFFAAGAFFTPDRKACFIAPPPPALKETVSADFPLLLNTGRIRDQWHTMTRTGRSTTLSAHRPEPFVEVHPDNAAGLIDGAFARIATVHGSCVLKVIISEGQQPGSIFVPIHWNGQTAACARVGELVSAHTDPYSGQPEMKATPCTIEPVTFASRGRVLSSTHTNLPAGTWWTRVAVGNETEYRLATNAGPLIWHDFAVRALGGDGDLVEELDASHYGAAVFLDDALHGWICIGSEEACRRFDPEKLRHRSTVPVPAAAAAKCVAVDTVICACFGVGIDSIRDALASGRVHDVGDIGRTLRAGSNCGSCLPEIKRIIRQQSRAA
jgi:assimilatory nitrate reductase catalytic subunit